MRHPPGTCYRTSRHGQAALALADGNAHRDVQRRSVQPLQQHAARSTQQQHAATIHRSKTQNPQKTRWQHTRQQAASSRRGRRDARSRQHIRQHTARSAIALPPAFRPHERHAPRFFTCSLEAEGCSDRRRVSTRRSVSVKMTLKWVLKPLSVLRKAA